MVDVHPGHRRHGHPDGDTTARQRWHLSPHDHRQQWAELPDDAVVGPHGRSAATFTSSARAALLVNKAGNITISDNRHAVAAISVVGTLPSFLTFHDNGDGSATLTAAATAVGSYTVKLRPAITSGRRRSRRLLSRFVSHQSSMSAATPRSSWARPTPLRSRSAAVRPGRHSALAARCPPA